MKNSLMARFGPSLGSLVILLALAGNVSAQTVADLAGTWRVLTLATPAQLTLQTNGSGQVTDYNEKNNFNYGSGTITFDASGTITAGTFSDNGGSAFSVTGSASVTGQGQISAVLTTPEGTETQSFFINTGADKMTGITRGSSDQQVLLLLKQPASCSTADLVGTWVGYSFDIPSDVALVPGGGQPSTGLTGGDGFGASVGSMTIDGSGNISGTFDNAFTGTVNDASPSAISTTIDAGGTFPLTLYINASKDILAATIISPDGNNNKELLMFVRQPASLSLSDLQGHWKIVDFQTPQSLNASMNNGFVVDITGKNDFDAKAQKLTSGSDGFFTADINKTVAGDMTPGSNGQVTLSFTNTLGEEVSATLQVSATKDSMYLLNPGGGGGSGQNELIMAVKVPPSSGTTEEAGLISWLTPTGLKFYWAADNDRSLFESTTIDGIFSHVSGTDGAHEYTPDTSSGNKFYFIKKVIPQ